MSEKRILLGAPNRMVEVVAGMPSAEHREIAQMAHEAQLELAQASGTPNRCPSKDELMEIGARLWDHTYRRTKNDVEAFEGLAQHFHDQDPVLGAMLNLPGDQIMLMGACRWADCGFPAVHLGHKYAAALMATHVPKEVLADLQPPWPCFMLELPNGLLPAIDDSVEGGGREISLRRVLVHRVEHTSEARFQYVALSDTSLTLWQHGLSADRWTGETTTGNGVWEGEAFALPLEDLEVRSTAMLGKLIANVCLAMSNPDNVKANPKCGPVGSIPVHRRSPEPKTRNYQLGQPITVDCREALEDYLRGRSRDGKSPTVQTLVRGHWKPRLGARMGYSVFVSPYFRGPDDAPILVRTHHLKG